MYMHKNRGMVCALLGFVIFLLFFSLSACGDGAKREREEVLAAFPGVVCWGDSLTAGAGGGGTDYPKVLESLMRKNVYDGMEVVNLGVGGESSATICARAGVYESLALTEGVALPAERIDTEIKLNFPVLRQGGENMLNPCFIGGVEGRIRIEQKAIDSEEYRYYFKRSETGAATFLAAGSAVTAAEAIDYKNYATVIFIGQNGGWNDDPQTLIAQQRALIERQTANADKFLILGLTSGSAAYRAELESAMQTEYGNKYVNLRAYLSSEAVRQAGVKLTEGDESEMSQGIVPAALRADGVHLNGKGYAMTGNLVYERMNDLGYFDGVKQIREKYAA